MMVLAIGTGDPLEGAVIMFAFTLGASPVFFGLAYLTTQLGQKLEARFLQLVAVMVFVLGLVSIDGGLALLGSPLSFNRIVNTLTPAPVTPPQTQPSVIFITATPPAQSQPATVQPALQTLIYPTVAPAQAQPSPFDNPVLVGPQSLPASQAAEGDTQAVTPADVVNINVLDYGYDPPISRAPAGQPVQLNLITNNTYGCTRAFVIPALDMFQILPDTGVTTIELPAQPTGSVLYFTCSMGMFGGQIQF